MATIDLSNGLGGAPRPVRSLTNIPYFVEREIDFAAAATAKASALAAADVIEAIDVPANTMVLNAGIEVTAVATGESNDNTLDLGITGVDADCFVDGFDLDAAAAGAYAQNAAAYQPLIVGATADTIDVLIATATTAPTGGKIRVWALLCNIDAKPAPGGVDRDTLA
jgi:hypothetical protein